MAHSIQLSCTNGGPVARYTFKIWLSVLQSQSVYRCMVYFTTTAKKLRLRTQLFDGEAVTNPTLLEKQVADEMPFKEKKKVLKFCF